MLGECACSSAPLRSKMRGDLFPHVEASLLLIALQDLGRRPTGVLWGDSVVCWSFSINGQKKSSIAGEDVGHAVEEKTSIRYDLLLSLCKRRSEGAQLCKY